MTRQSLAIIFLLLISDSTLSQTISNVRTEVKNGRVEIQYDLFGKPDETYNISISATRSNGSNVTPQKVAGEMRGVTPGNNKLIFWEPQLERRTVDGWKITLKADVDSKTRSMLIKRQEEHNRDSIMRQQKHYRDSIMREVMRDRGLAPLDVDSNEIRRRIHER